MDPVGSKSTVPIKERLQAASPQVSIRTVLSAIVPPALVIAPDKKITKISSPVKSGPAVSKNPKLPELPDPDPMKVVVGNEPPDVITDIFAKLLVSALKSNDPVMEPPCAPALAKSQAMNAACADSDRQLRMMASAAALRILIIIPPVDLLTKYTPICLMEAAY